MKRGSVREERLKNGARRISTKEAAASSLMEGFGSRYITPYALSFGASNTQIAFLSSLPNLLANFSQLFSLRLMRKHSRKKLVVFGVTFQALMWLPLIAVGVLYFFGILGSWAASLLVVVLYTILMLIGAIASPAWSSWMKDILSKDANIFLSNRTKLYTAGRRARKTSSL